MAEAKSLSARPRKSAAPKLAPAGKDRALATKRSAPTAKPSVPTAKLSALAAKLPTQASRIRAAKAADLTSLSLLFDAYRVFYRKPTNVKLARQFIGARLKQHDSTIFVAEHQTGDLLGFVQLYPSFSSTAAAPIYVLNDLFVAPKGRQQGLGEALMHAAYQHAKKQGCARLDLGTERTNRIAQRLYEKQGYQKDRHFFHYSLAIT